MTRLEGIVTDISFRNEENGFTVLHLQPKDLGAHSTCIGIMPTLRKGETICAEGDWETHQKFGNRFSVKQFYIVRPTSSDGILQLLSSGFIKNIGPSRAKILVDHFGASTLEILDNEPEKLVGVPGIGLKTLKKIKTGWQEHRHLKDLILFLQNFEITINLAYKIYKTYGSQAREKISRNPYALVDDVWGIGFFKADQIARKMGFAHNSFDRIRAGLIYLLQEATSDGHCFLLRDVIIDKAKTLLEVPQEQISFSIDHTIQTNSIIQDDFALYLPSYHSAEREVAKRIQEKIRSASTNHLYKQPEIERWLQLYQTTTKWAGDEMQVRAVIQSIMNPLFMLTGGPGTGKTTTLHVVVSFFRDHQKRVVLAAPTGRAAQRMGTLAGIGASTIHRLLESRPGSGNENVPFGRNETNPIEADIIILDEMSMVDLMLMRSFLRAVRPETHIVLVGDNNQLPSVGAGAVLSDLIESCAVPHVQLTTIFRQAAASRIVTAAHEIINGTVPKIENGMQDNCFFIHEDDPERCVALIGDLVTQRLPKRYGFDPVADIQVLSPMHRGLLGTSAINSMLQNRIIINKSKKISRGDHSFFIGDKVMQIKNNYELDVFNGDIGFIDSIAEDNQISVNYDGKIVHYQNKDLDEITPAYCISIHKSQGCEFKAVVLVVNTQHFVMLQRNLLYTALTRARSICVMVGTTRALKIAVSSTSALLRNSRLKTLI